MSSAISLMNNKIHFAIKEKRAIGFAIGFKKKKTNKLKQTSFCSAEYSGFRLKILRLKNILLFDAFVY